VTKLLPVLAAVVVFIVLVGFSYGKTATRVFDSRDPPHLAMYGIAFSMTLCGCLPAVMLAATVGTPQTHLSVRRILGQFADRAGPIGLEHEPGRRRQLRDGTVPSWRFDRWPWTGAASSRSAARLDAIHHRPALRELCAILTVLLGSLGAIWLSASVPPVGKCLNCRVQAELAILFTYLTSYVGGIAIGWVCRARERDSLHFWLLMAKDVCSTLILTAIIVLTGIGSLNRWGCWTTCDGAKLCVADLTRDMVDTLLKSRYPAIIFSTFGALVVSWTAIAFWLWDGMSVYMQRDDDEIRWVRSTCRSGEAIPLTNFDQESRPLGVDVNVQSELSESERGFSSATSAPSAEGVDAEVGDIVPILAAFR